MTVNIAADIAHYLETLGEGTVGIDLFVDNVPETPEALIAVCDTGGKASAVAEAPDTWRDIAVKLRALTRADGYDAVWRVTEALIRPPGGAFTVGANRYQAQLVQLPAVYEVDAAERYSFACAMTVRRVVDSDDDWLAALADYSQSALGAGWHVYRSWPGGGERPSVTWRLVQVQAQPASSAAVRLSKRYAGQLCGADANDALHASAALVRGLAELGKLPLDAAAHRYLTVVSPSADMPSGDIGGGQVTVTLTRLMRREESASPVISALHMNPTIMT